MTEQECLAKMKAPGDVRSQKHSKVVIQILVTSSCTLACTNCTQLSQLRRKPWFMTPDQFDLACRSLQGYKYVVGVFGGTPNLSPHFKEYCRILRSHFPKQQCGLWSNALLGHGADCRETFNPTVSNLNCHLDRDAYQEMKDTWPESMPFGLNVDSRHSPCYVAMKDVLKKVCPECNGTGDYTWSSDEGGSPVLKCGVCNGKGNVYDESLAYDLISKCDINANWSSLLGVFRGELRAWFCEIAGAQSIYHQDDPDYPDTGLDPTAQYEVQVRPNDGRLETTLCHWWQLGMPSFAGQVRKHCHECSVPLRGYGSLAQSEDGVEQVSETHAAGYLPKKKGRRVELVQVMDQLKSKNLKVTEYLQGATK
jgi:hypothetical protein